MSWWDDEDDILGDEPADRIKASLRTLLARRRDAGQPALSADELLEAFAAALQAARLRPAFTGLALLVGDAPPREYRGSSQAGPADARAAFAEAFPAIVEAYRKRFDRAPRPVEMVKTLDFLAGADPHTYFPDLVADTETPVRLVMQ
ncbi:hypothetical protein [Xanthomonas sp. SI]|uniref:hypothetical protein n=1 Tax=Xanthomonas sp. SI TaxID=2724123 RepID=UPI00163A55AD|nr:hypothetical protein [Xanthomonas sp. SI]QNH14599.1 hypothetical protein HEP75_04072 [Xanthomonas sp. SI]